MGLAICPSNALWALRDATRVHLLTTSKERTRSCPSTNSKAPPETSHTPSPPRTQRRATASVQPCTDCVPSTVSPTPGDRSHTPSHLPCRSYAERRATAVAYMAPHHRGCAPIATPRSYAQHVPTQSCSQRWATSAVQPAAPRTPRPYAQRRGIAIVHRAPCHRGRAAMHGSRPSTQRRSIAAADPAPCDRSHSPHPLATAVVCPALGYRRPAPNALPPRSLTRQPCAERRSPAPNAKSSRSCTQRPCASTVSLTPGRLVRVASSGRPQSYSQGSRGRAANAVPLRWGTYVNVIVPDSLVFWPLTPSKLPRCCANFRSTTHWASQALLRPTSGSRIRSKCTAGMYGQFCSADSVSQITE